MESGNHWYSKSLGDGMWSPIASAEIKNIFQPLFESTGKPSEMAVFTRYEEGRLHCEVVAYFSPAAVEVAKAVEAQPCDQPVRAGLGLLAGDSGCWSALFAESGE